jgi:hypothetical protein
MVMKTCIIGYVETRLGNEDLYIVDATNRTLHYYVEPRTLLGLIRLPTWTP